MRLVLSKADRERLGCPEVLPFDLSTLTTTEAVVLQGLGFTPLSLRRRLMTKQLEDGDFDLDYAAWRVALWLALSREGVEADVRTLDWDVLNWRILGDEETEPMPPGDEPGKAEDSAGSTSSPTKSSTRSRTSRRRSTSTGSRS